MRIHPVRPSRTVAAQGAPPACVGGADDVPGKTIVRRDDAKKAEYRTRTDDPFLTMEVLYQLS